MKTPPEYAPSRRRIALSLIILAALIVATVWILLHTDSNLPIAPSKPSTYLGLTGQIVAESGRLISSAVISVRQQATDGQATETRSDADGHFVFTHLNNGAASLLITAANFTCKIRDLQIDAQTKPIEVLLIPGSPQTGRVIDSHGNPLPGAMVALVWSRFGPTSFFLTDTDSRGRFKTPNTPAEESTIYISKTGYKSETLLPASSPPDPVITLEPSQIPTLTGHVTDAITHQPISAFTILTCGSFSASTPSKFLSTNRFQNGTYHLTPRGFGDEVKAYFLRVEANGYRSSISPPLHQSANQDFALQPAPAWVGHIFNPDGRPAADARVAFIYYDPVAFQDGNIVTDIISHKPMLAAADGSFQIAQQDDPFELWAWSPAGVAHWQSSDSPAKNPEITLTPWATLRIKIPWAATSPSPITIVAKSPANPFDRTWVYSVKPDADGTISIERLPPMPGEITEIQLARTKPTWQSGPTLLAHLSPTQTTQLDLTRGATLTGHLTGDNPALSLIPLPDRPINQLPADYVAAAKFAPSVLRFIPSFDSTGHFTLPAVPPGKYAYLGWADLTNPILYSSGLITIPPNPSTSPINLGDLPESKIIPMTVAQAAPPVLGCTLDGHPISTDQFQGKFILFVVLDSLWRTTPSLPTLTTIAAQLVNNPRIALVAVNSDLQIGALPRRPPTLCAGWINGYLAPTPTNAPLYESLPPSPNWPAILIISPAGKILATGLTADETAAKLTRFLEQ